MTVRRAPVIRVGMTSSLRLLRRRPRTAWDTTKIAFLVET
jgi:hypothetical protein